MQKGDYLAGLGLGLFLSLFLGFLLSLQIGGYGIAIGITAAIFCAVRTILMAIDEQNKRLEGMVKIMVDILLNGQQSNKNE